MAKVRLVQKTVNVVLLFVFFASGLKLYTSALASLIAILINYYQIFSGERLKYLKTVWEEKGEWNIDYYSEIFPFQWRIALSWISGYFIYHLFNPVLFATEGAKVAGQMGMTIAALGAVFSLSSSWINTKLPLFSGLIAKKEYVKLDSIFNSTAKQLIVVNIILVGCYIIFAYMLQHLHFALGDRLLGPFPTILYASTIVANQLISTWAIYLRCHKKEPFMVYSIVSGVLCLLSTFFLGNKFGLNGIVGGYTFITVAIGLPWTYWIYITKKKEWHA